MLRESEASQGQRILGLDTLRAIAILLVLAAHAWPAKTNQKLAEAAGILGVEIFFVLSGFLIGKILLNLAISGRLQTWAQLTDFWRRRWYRTLPNYFLFLGLQLAWRSWVLGYPVVLLRSWDYFFFLQNFAERPAHFFGESWSLAVEEWFYLLYALCLWLILRRLGDFRKAWLVTTLVFLFVPQLWRSYSVVQNGNLEPEITPTTWRQIWDYDYRKLVIFRLDVLMYGVAAAFLASHYPGRWKWLSQYWWVGMGILGLVFSSLVCDFPLDRGRPGDGLLLWPSMAVGIALVLCRCSFIVSAGAWVTAIIQTIAKLSYALYLCHGLVILVIKQVFGPKSSWPLARNTWEWSLLVVTLSFLVAYATYRWFEKPMTDLRNRQRHNSKAV